MPNTLTTGTVINRFAAATLLVLAVSPEAAGSGGDLGAVRGRILAEDHCARCHGVVAGARSRHAEAPPFAEIAGRYPPAFLAEALAEGLVVGHPDMPPFRFTPDQVADLIGHLNSLR